MRTATSNKQETIYCYSEAERDAASAKLGKSCEITRFKGLGEISPKEFQQFIGKGMKLSQVEYAPKHDASGILTFYMAKNTPERKDFIMGNLVVPVPGVLCVHSHPCYAFTAPSVESRRGRAVIPDTSRRSAAGRVRPRATGPHPSRGEKNSWARSGKNCAASGRGNS